METGGVALLLVLLVLRHHAMGEQLQDQRWLRARSPNCATVRRGQQLLGVDSLTSSSALLLNAPHPSGAR